MIKFSQMLQGFKPCHEIETNLLISRFECGCVSTILFSKNSNISIQNYFWYSSRDCKHSHEIDFSEMVEIVQNIGLVELITEIKAFNSIKISKQLSLNYVKREK